MRSLLVVVFAASLGIAVQATAQIAAARTWPALREAVLDRVPFEGKAIIGCLQFPADQQKPTPLVKWFQRRLQ